MTSIKKTTKDYLSDDCVDIVLDNIRQTLKKHAAELECISINSKLVGRNQPVFVVAEAACNHMCNLELARKMIDKAAEAGADAIKFQTYKAENLVTADAVAFWGEEKISQLEYYKRLDRFGRKEYEELFSYARENGLIGFSSSFDEESAEMLNDIGMPVFKIASCDIPDIRSLKQIAGFGKPVILSTGASTTQEIDRAIETIFQQGNYQLMLLACTLSYPTPNEDANLRRILTLKKRYPGIIIGLSDHTEPDTNMVIPSLAAALGASIIEKHYTLDRTMTGSGHFFAVNPKDLKKMVQNIRLTHSVLGTGELGVTISEKKAWSSARRSIVANITIPKGTEISNEMIGLKRPSKGMDASRIYEVVGKKALKTIAADQSITLDMLSGE